MRPVGRSVDGLCKRGRSCLFRKAVGGVERIELLPYHAMDKHKYEALGKPLTKFEVPTAEKMVELKKIIES